jgi:hypothetical protein
VTVDQRDPNVGAIERPRRVEPAKTAAEDQDVNGQGSEFSVQGSVQTFKVQFIVQGSVQCSPVQPNLTPNLEPTLNPLNPEP